MTIKILKELGKRIDEESKKLEVFLTKLENRKNNQSSLKNS